MAREKNYDKKNQYHQIDRVFFINKFVRSSFLTAFDAKHQIRNILSIEAPHGGFYGNSAKCHTSKWKKNKY